MKGFASKTDSMARPSSKLGGSNIGGSAGQSAVKGVSGGTNAQGDWGTKGGMKGGAATFAHEKNGRNTVASPPGGSLAKGERKGPPGNV